MLSDQQLLDRVRMQDTWAFEALFSRYRDSICRHLVKIVRDDNAAEDLVQEVFLRVWTHADQWDGRGQFKGWLYKIATNFALNHIRTAKRRKEQTLDLSIITDDEESCIPGWMMEEASLQPESAVLNNERRELIRQLVDQLPEEKREVLRLVHEAEMDIRQTAEALGIPEGTVKSRLHNARKRLAQEWKTIDSEMEELK